MKHRIYKITNTITGEVYIGETSKTLDERWKTHLRAIRGGRKNSLSESIARYGEESFKMELIEYCNKDDAVDIEEQWISFYNSYHNGLNDAPRKYVTSLGYTYTEERKEEYRKRFSGEGNPMYGKKATDFMTKEEIEIWKENISKSGKGRRFTEDHKRKLSENSGRKKGVIKLKNGEIVEKFDSITKAHIDSGLKIHMGTFRNWMLKNKEINGFYYKDAE